MPFGSATASVLAVVLAVAGVFSYQWSALVPQLGIQVLYRLREIRIVLAALSLGLALEAYLLTPSPLYSGVLVLVLVLTPLSGFLVARRLFVPLDDPERLPASEVTLDGDALVVGVEVDGVAHAWAVDTLVPRHIVNDQVDGRPVVAAWCAYCNSGVVYGPTVQGKRLTFEPVTIRQRNMVMRDRETGTLWQHATGEALAGPHEGTELPVLGSQLMTWRAWTREHPESTLALEPDEWPGLLPRGLTRRLADRTEHVALPGQVETDRRLPFTAEVIGVELNGSAVAYPLDEIKRAGWLSDEVGGEPIEISFDADANRVTVTSDGDPVAFHRTRWMGWFEFHPDTAVYGEAAAPA